MGFSKNMTFLEENLKTREAEDFASLKLLKEFRYAGFSLSITGTLLTVGASYNFAHSNGQEQLQNAYKTFDFPEKRTDITIPPDDHPMKNIVENAIDHQAPHAATQSLTFEKGVFVLEHVPSEKKKIDVEQLNTEIRQKTSEAIDGYNYEYYLGIGTGVTMALAGAFLLHSAGKTAHALKNRYGKEPIPSPAQPISDITP